MARTPKYRLQVLLTLRVREKKRSEIILARAMEHLKKEQEKLKKMEKEKKEIIAETKVARHKMDLAMGHGAYVGQGCTHVNFLRKLKEDLAKKEEEIESQKEVILEAKEKVVKARRGYIDAVKKLRTMEKHKELWVKKVRAELTRKEEKEMDELGQTIQSLRRWRGEKSVFQMES